MSQLQVLFVAMTFAGGSMAAVTLGADEIVYSGPQAGEGIPPLKVLGVYDDHKGRILDLAAESDGKPFLFVFVHRPTRPAAELSCALLHYAQVREQAGLYSALIFLAADMTAAERHMREADGWWHNGPPAGISLDGAEGPGAYGLNREVTMTILIGKDHRVTANFALIQPSDSDAVRVLREVIELVGGDLPTRPEVEFLRSPSRLPPIIRQWENGKAPTDVTLRERICELLRTGDGGDDARKAAAAIDAYMAEHPELRGELGEAARLVLVRNYGSRPPIIELVPEQRELFAKWDKDYFAPEILAVK